VLSHSVQHLVPDAALGSPSRHASLTLDPLDIVPAVAQVECLQDIVPPR
jgi:hypothetical protein